MLLGSPGTAFSKEQILQNVWPSVIVGEGNVKVQISYLRKALGDLSEDIVCVSGDGYVFTGDVVVQ
jgi:DNA-binding winged helix-turn-helix (wHTH) protein